LNYSLDASTTISPIMSERSERFIHNISVYSLRPLFSPFLFFSFHLFERFHHSTFIELVFVSFSRRIICVTYDLSHGFMAPSVFAPTFLSLYHPPYLHFFLLLTRTPYHLSSHYYRQPEMTHITTFDSCFYTALPLYTPSHNTT